MTGFGLSFHHLGLAVPRPDAAVTFLAGLGYAIGARGFDPEQNVSLMLCPHPQMPTVEIIYPGDAPGPVHKYVARHASGIVYHVCFETADLRASIAAIEAANCVLFACCHRGPPFCLADAPFRSTSSSAWD
jgi:hypothetical protein